MYYEIRRIGTTARISEFQRLISFSTNVDRCSRYIHEGNVVDAAHLPLFLVPTLTTAKIQDIHSATTFPFVYKIKVSRYQCAFYPVAQVAHMINPWLFPLKKRALCFVFRSCVVKSFNAIRVTRLVRWLIKFGWDTTSSAVHYAHHTKVIRKKLPPRTQVLSI